MELLLLPPFPIFLAIFLISIMVVIKKGYKSRDQTQTSALPLPGPSELPIIGSIHRLVGSLPHRALADLAKKHGPLMLLRLGQVNHVVVSSRDAAEEVMKIHDLNFASRPELAAVKILSYGLSGIIFSPFGNYWRQMRKLCFIELLNPKRGKFISPVREDEISNLVNNILLSTPSAVNLSIRLMEMSNNIVFRAIIGGKCRQQQRFLAVMKEIEQLIAGFCVADLFPSLKFLEVFTGVRSRSERIHRQVDEILDEIIGEHEAKKGSGDESEEVDLVDVLLSVKDHGELEIPFTVNNLKAVILDLFAAGTETSSTVVEWAMAELMRNPNSMEKAQAEVRRVVSGRSKVEESDLIELEFLKLVIKETLRLHPPAPLLLPRVAKESCSIQGYMVPAGSRVIVNAWAIGRDPQCWEDADSFKPDRFDGSSVDFKGASFEFIPFGAGRRICPGMAFGLTNVELALAQLLVCFDWRLPPGMKPEDLDMSEKFGATTPRKSELYLMAIPFVPQPVC